MKVTIRNERGQLVPFNITDRPSELKTTSVGSPPNFIPPMSTLSFALQEGEIIVLSNDGGLTLKKENGDA